MDNKSLNVRLQFSSGENIIKDYRVEGQPSHLVSLGTRIKEAQVCIGWWFQSSFLTCDLIKDLSNFLN